MSQQIINAGTMLLKAYALAKAGKRRSAAELFLEASATKEIDALMNGFAGSLIDLKASMEEDDLSGIEDDTIEYDDIEEDEPSDLEESYDEVDSEIGFDEEE